MRREVRPGNKEGSAEMKDHEVMALREMSRLERVEGKEKWWSCCEGVEESKTLKIEFRRKERRLSLGRDFASWRTSEMEARLLSSIVRVVSSRAGRSSLMADKPLDEQDSAVRAGKCAKIFQI